MEILEFTEIVTYPVNSSGEVKFDLFFKENILNIKYFDYRNKHQKSKNCTFEGCTLKANAPASNTTSGNFKKFYKIRFDYKYPYDSIRKRMPGCEYIIRFVRFFNIKKF